MRLRLFVDLKLPPDALKLLREGTAAYELLLPKNPAQSVLAQGEPDPLLTTAGVAFGQPDPATLAKADGLKWVHVSSSGVTRYDTREFRAMAAERRFMVSNSARVYAEPCALHALSFILAQARGLSASLGQQTPGGSETWNTLRASCVSLEGQTLVIVGYGAIGERLAEMLHPLGMRVMAYRRQARGNEGVPVVRGNALAEVLRQAEHVVNILPQSEQTLSFFDKERLALFRPEAVFYNIGRGSTVDQEALLEALRARRLKAAWLDVTDPEPLPLGHPLLEEPHCHITPHIAGGHAGEAQSLVRHFLANLRRFEKGEPLVDRVM